MKTRSSGDGDRLAHSRESDLPRWRLWLARVTIFAVLFFLLITAFAALSGIVERFFITLYVE
jgi:hypothetical protein